MLLLVLDAAVDAATLDPVRTLPEPSRKVPIIRVGCQQLQSIIIPEYYYHSRVLLSHFRVLLSLVTLDVALPVDTATLLSESSRKVLIIGVGRQRPNFI